MLSSRNLRGCRDQLTSDVGACNRWTKWSKPPQLRVALACRPQPPIDWWPSQSPASGLLRFCVVSMYLRMDRIRRPGDSCVTSPKGWLVVVPSARTAQSPIPRPGPGSQSKSPPQLPGRETARHWVSSAAVSTPYYSNGPGFAATFSQSLPLVALPDECHRKEREITGVVEPSTSNHVAGCGMPGYFVQIHSIQTVGRGIL